MRSYYHSTTKKVVITFTSVVLILFAVIFFTIAILILTGHSSVASGGALYSFLPTFGENGTQVFAQTETANPEPPPAEPLAYVPAQYEYSPAVYEYEPYEEYVYEPEPYEINDLMYDIFAYERMLYELMQYEHFYDGHTSDIPIQLPSITPTAPPPPPPPVPQTQPGHSNSPFSVFSFYIPENSSIYDYFHYNRPYLEKDEVVWKVNAHLHLPFYSYIRINYEPNPLLINPFYRLPYGFMPCYLVPVNSPDCNLRGTPEAVAAFHLLRATARQYGFNLSITSAFRTAAHQRRLWANRNFTDGVVARPYHSEHQTGRALDLWGPHGLLDSRGATPTGIWVAENAHRYGFILRYRADTTHITSYIHEPWHITYVGVAISMYMHENNILSLEEFVGRNPGVTIDWGTGGLYQEVQNDHEME